MSFVVAYAFNCDLTLPQILTELRENTSYKWYERDSHYWGDYISARTSPDIITKIFIEDPGYLLELKIEDNTLRRTWQRAADKVIDQLRPLLGARNVRRAPSNN